jgi:O-antigen ligase
VPAHAISSHTRALAFRCERETGRVPLTWFVLLLLIVPAFIDLPSVVSFGRISAMGLLTIVQAAITAAAVIACHSYPRFLLARLLPYGMFLAWAGLSAVWAPPTFGGVQNGIVYALFGLAILLAGTIAASDPVAMASVIDRGVGWMDAVGLSLALVCLITQGLPNDDAQWFIGPRSFALMGLIPLSWHVAHWYSGWHRSGVKAWVWITAIGLSLSRTALAAALLYVAIAIALQVRFRPRSLVLKVPAGALAVGVSAAFILNSAAMKERLFIGDTGLTIGEVAINASGRMAMWPIIVESARESPVIGQGLGSSQQAIRVLDDIGHPHNDYLRVWHDLGHVGLFLLLASVCGWLAQLRRRWRASDRCRHPRAPIEMAAFFALFGLILAAFTDNAIIYPFVMGPLGVLVGAGLGISAYDRFDGRRRGECGA